MYEWLNKKYLSLIYLFFIIENKKGDGLWKWDIVGIMNDGSAKNSIPAYCEISIDFRIANKKHIEIITKKMKNWLKNIMQKLT